MHMHRKDRGGHHRSRFGPSRSPWDEEESRGHGGRGRSFEYGKLRFVLLQLLGEQPSHGYQLIKAVEDKTAGAYVPSPGVVYPTLALLEDLGYIAAAANDDNRRLYKITAAGRKYLVENKAVLEQVNGRLSDAAATRGAGDSPQIIRAMHNLKMALRLKLSEPPLSGTQIQAIAAALDAAAAAVERI
jgi:DNA-binding PadR family transcriptional regulator